jgi:cytidylate kinase
MAVESQARRVAMAVITVSGEPGCRSGEVARLAAHRLGFEHVSATRLESLLEEEFGSDAVRQARLWPLMAGSILVRTAAESHLVVGVDGAERLFDGFPALLRVRIVAPLSRRIGNLMVDERLDRQAARSRIREREREISATRKQRFGRASASPESFDLTLNAQTTSGPQMADLVVAAYQTRGLEQHGLLAPAAEAQLQFRFRLQLARHGIQPRGHARLRATNFGHPSEEIFAKLLDFYGISWEYEPRSFPIAWDDSGRVLESFTPDFFLPELNLYVELTTMKQSLVTRKNRKIRLLREMYPQINIQVFYQKDIQDLILKYGLAHAPAAATTKSE